MTNHQSPARAAQLASGQRALRFLALAAVIVGVLGLAAAAFELSYPGIHAIALVAGVSPALARLYPLIFDAMLVVASAAILSLRGAGAVTRCYAWFSLLLLLCAAAGADALHATGSKLPHRGTAATAAIIPWALVLLGFGLLLAMLRHARLRRAQAAAVRASAAPLAAAAATRAPAAVVPAAVAPAAAVTPTAVTPAAAMAPAAAVTPELALDAEPGHDDPTSDEAHSGSDSPASWVPRARVAEDGAGRREFTADPAPVMAPAPTVEVFPGRHAGPGLDHDAGPELDHDAGPELDSATGARPDHDSGAEDHDSGAELPPGSTAGLSPGDTAGRDPETGRGPASQSEPEPAAAAPAAPFERMWSSPVPPDV
jgi:Protein of unknown function (DUF2637)